MNPTPGPWKLRKEERPGGIPRIIIGDGFNDIGEVYTSADGSFGWPDARLIAAAPSLYRELVMLRIFINLNLNELLNALGEDKRAELIYRLNELNEVIDWTDGDETARLESSNRLELRVDE